MSGKALAAGIAANPDDQEPMASAIPLTCFSNDANSEGLLLHLTETDASSARLSADRRPTMRVACSANCLGLFFGGMVNFGVATYSGP